MIGQGENVPPAAKATHRTDYEREGGTHITSRRDQFIMSKTPPYGVPCVLLPPHATRAGFDKTPSPQSEFRYQTCVAEANQRDQERRRRTLHHLSESAL